MFLDLCMPTNCNSNQQNNLCFVRNMAKNLFFWNVIFYKLYQLPRIYNTVINITMDNAYVNSYSISTTIYFRTTLHAVVALIYIYIYIHTHTLNIHKGIEAPLHGAMHMHTPWVLWMYVSIISNNPFIFHNIYNYIQFFMHSYHYICFLWHNIWILVQMRLAWIK